MAFLEWLQQLPFSVWMNESSSLWAFPMFLFMHTLGMSVVAGGSAAIDFALLGFWPRNSLKSLKNVFPYSWRASRSTRSPAYPSS